ncbi:unnamed protein product [Kuraishia capsulata CBS 1993]|uniref:Calnexin n=1 Tax=Kuraishia capsulata CBS 1993 TaxID=1382522 RepID=W6MJN6_9ASCO|nr:uncharacterized protein KUCA_T00000658001 [Kuraishia capsulata CBS 1993]CDK24692.1 unnamed protein product [Kuraishia capsulata CBS 1993]
MKLSVLAALCAYMAMPGVVVAEKSAVDHPTYSPIAKLNEDSFFEPFDDEDWEKKWVVSHAKRDGEFAYVGKWNVEESSVNPGFAGDKGLVLKSEAAHHAISLQLPEPFDNKGKTLVLQYEVKLQKGLTCGGAYVKLLSAEGLEGDFSNETPYQVMFGPDRCGATNKVHLILKRKNPITGEYEEKHLVSAPMSRVVKTTSLYTLIITPEQEFEIRINGDVVIAGSLFEESLFAPSFNPPKEIADANDLKPADWVDEELIPDPTAVKPADWDEEAPFYIDDVDAVKPDDWDEDAEDYIPDPEASIPEDWDEEEDGEWLAPEIPNPACQDHGCGPWSPPQIKNPAYKGKFVAPLIPNPEYQGEWAPRLVANPDYYEDATPADLEPIGGIGFELWTMSEDILFDNILLGHDVAEAEYIGNATFTPKVEIEQEAASKEAPKAAFEPETPPSYKEDAISFVSAYKEVIVEYATEKVGQLINVFWTFVHEADLYFTDFMDSPLNTFLTRFPELCYFVGYFLAGLTFVMMIFGFIVASLVGDAVPGLIETPKTEDVDKNKDVKEQVTEANGAEANETVATKRSVKST